MTTQLTIPTLVQSIIDLHRKNGKQIATPEEIKLLTEFIKGQPEPKELTKLEKIFAKYVPKFVQLSITEINPDIVGDITRLKSVNYGSILSFNVWGLDKYMAVIDSYGQDEKAALESLAGNMAFVEEIKKKLKDLRVSLKSDKIKKQQLAIKGLVPANLLVEIEIISKKWEKIIYQRHFDWLIRMRHHADDFLKTIGYSIEPYNRENQSDIKRYRQIGVIDYAPKNALVMCTDEALQKTAKRVAAAESESFLFKMCDKLGGIKLDGTSITTPADDNTPFRSVLVITGNRYSFLMSNTIVTNYSILGNSFYQYPCKFENVVIDGTKYTVLSEYEVKTKINALWTK